MWLSIVAVVASTAYISQSYSWSALPPLPTPLGYTIGGVYDNKIHVLGGYDSIGLQRNEYSARIQYDASTNTISLSDWSVTSISPTFPSITELGSDTQQYVTIDEFIYIMGTDDRTFLEHAPGKLVIYNMKTQSFKDPATYSSAMNVARSGNCITTDGIYLYSIGGHDSYGYATTDVVKYHTQTNEWSNGVAINTARYSAQCALVLSNLYVIGGGSHNGAVLNMEVFNLNEATQWVVSAIPAAITSSFAYNANSNGIYLAGGAASVSYVDAFSTAYFYNITRNEWSTKESMLTAVYAFASITYQPDTEWMFIIHIGGVTNINSCGLFSICPVYSAASQYTPIRNEVSNITYTSSTTTTLSPQPPAPSDLFATLSAHISDTTESSNSTQTGTANVSSNAEDVPPKTTGDTKDIMAVLVEGILFLIKTPLFYVALIIILVILTVCICFCCRKTSKAKAPKDKIIPLSNPMVILLGIGEYDEQPQQSDFLGDTFVTDLPVHIDIRNLLSLFKDALRYQIYPQYSESTKIKTHWTELELIALLKKQAQLLEYNLISSCDDKYNDDIDRFDGLILVLSSHGIQDHIITSDHRKIEKNVIHRIFSIDHPESRNIPRIVLFDCCDGNDRRKHVDSVVSVIGKQYGMQQLEASSHKPSWQKGDKNPDYKLATIHAANVGFRSNMSTTRGSFVIHKFVEKTKASLMQYGEGQRLSELFDEIQQELGDTNQLPVFMWNNGTGNVKFMTKDNDSLSQEEDSHNVNMKQLMKRNQNFGKYQVVHV